MSETRKRYIGGYIKFVSSWNGTATFEASLHRTTRNGTREYLPIEIEVSRSDLHCIVKALKQFADKEREAVGGLPL